MTAKTPSGASHSREQLSNTERERDLSGGKADDGTEEKRFILGEWGVRKGPEVVREGLCDDGGMGGPPYCYSRQQE